MSSSARNLDDTATSSMSIDTLPCQESYPGPFNFQLHLPADCSTHKWTVRLFKITTGVFVSYSRFRETFYRIFFSDFSLNQNESVFDFKFLINRT